MKYLKDKELPLINTKVKSINKYKKISYLYSWLLLFISLILFIILGDSKELLRNNIRFIALLTASKITNLNPYWYGAGLRTIPKIQVGAIISEHINNSHLSYCAEWEKLLIHKLTENQEIDEQQKYPIHFLMFIRDNDCRGNFSEAMEIISDIIEPNGRIIREIDLKYRYGYKDSAYPLIIEYICPSNEIWCKDYFYAVWLSGEDYIRYAKKFERYAKGEIMENMVSEYISVGFLEEMSISNLLTQEYTPIVDFFTPIILLGVLPSRDNYIQYPTLIAQGSVLIYKIRGEVVGNTGDGCLSPRLTLFEDGKYSRDVSREFIVNRKFDVEFSYRVPDNVNEIIPRISIGENCILAGHKLIIYQSEITFGINH